MKLIFISVLIFFILTIGLLFYHTRVGLASDIKYLSTVTYGEQQTNALVAMCGAMYVAAATHRVFVEPFVIHSYLGYTHARFPNFPRIPLTKVYNVSSFLALCQAIGCECILQEQMPHSLQVMERKEELPTIPESSCIPPWRRPKDTLHPMGECWQTVPEAVNSLASPLLEPHPWVRFEFFHNWVLHPSARAECNAAKFDYSDTYYEIARRHLSGLGVASNQYVALQLRTQTFAATPDTVQILTKAFMSVVEQFPGYPIYVATDLHGSQDYSGKEKNVFHHFFSKTLHSILPATKFLKGISDRPEWEGRIFDHLLCRTAEIFVDIEGYNAGSYHRWIINTRKIDGSKTIILHPSK